MAQEINTSSVSLDHPPTYAEAMECVQLSPRQLTQVMLDQQQNNIQNNNARSPNDQEEAFAKELRKKKINKIVCLMIQLDVVIFPLFILLYFV